MSTSEAFNSTARCKEQTKFWPRRKGTHRRHRSHFGSRYKTGCCGHAGLLHTSWFESRLPISETISRFSLAARWDRPPFRWPSLSTARATPHPTRSVFGANPPTQSRLKHRPPGVGAPLPTDTQFGGHPTAPGASPARRGSVHPQIEDRHPEHAVAGARYRTNPSVPQCPVARLGRPQNTTAEAGCWTNPPILLPGQSQNATARAMYRTNPAGTQVSTARLGQPQIVPEAGYRTNPPARICRLLHNSDSNSTAEPGTAQTFPSHSFFELGLGSHRTPWREPGAEQTRPPAFVFSPPFSDSNNTAEPGTEQTLPVPQLPFTRLDRPQNTTAGAGYRTNPAAQSLLHLGPGSDRTPRREPCTEQTRPARPTVFPSHTPFGQPHNTAGARNRTNRGAEQTARPQLPLAPFGSHKDKIAEPGAEQTRPPAIALSSTRQPQ